MSVEQLVTFTTLALSNGARVVCDSKDRQSHYLTVQVQPSAAASEVSVRVDRKLAEAILEGLDSGGQLSKREIETKIMPTITDAARYGEGEAILARLLLAAIDDRRRVELNGQRVRLTDAAEEALLYELRSFWGKLGAKARWGRDDPANRHLRV